MVPLQRSCLVILLLSFVLLVLTLGSSFAPVTAATASAASAAPVTPQESLLTDMQSELMRASKELAKADPAPYYLSYSVADQDTMIVAGTNGAIVTAAQSRARRVDVITRIGTPALDNTHGDLRGAAVVSGTLPLNQDHAAIARTFWDLTNRGYRQSVSAYMRAKTSSDVRAAEEDNSPDFSKEAPQTHVDVAALLPANESLWRDRVRKMAALFRAHHEVETSGVIVVIQNEDHYFVTTEGTRLLTPVRIARMFVFASARAEDGMDLTRMESYQNSDPEKLPGETEIAPVIAKMISDLKALQASPIAEPFNGPAMLSGRAAAVLTHEVLGHRLEGQRQRGDDEGQTFTKKVNQAVLPKFLSVVDDPTRKLFGATDLSGFYQFDDEGMPSQAVKLIDDGVLRNFLLSRMPVKVSRLRMDTGAAKPAACPLGGKAISSSPPPKQSPRQSCASNSSPK